MNWGQDMRRTETEIKTTDRKNIHIHIIPDLPFVYACELFTFNADIKILTLPDISFVFIFCLLTYYNALPVDPCG